MSTATITDQLDKLEANLPSIPARIVHLQRTVAGATFDRTVAAVHAAAASTRNIFDVARISGRTVTGQARSVGDDVAKSARTGVSTVVGQARAATNGVAATARTGVRTVGGQATAQGRHVARTAERETTKLIDSAIDAVDDTVNAVDSVVEQTVDATETGSGSGPYESRTKAELLERAKELDIEGRSAMSKKQLIAALRTS